MAKQDELEIFRPSRANGEPGKGGDETVEGARHELPGWRHRALQRPRPSLRPITPLVCIAKRIANCTPDAYADCMAQLVTRVEDDLAAAVDQLVAAGVVASRSAAVRLALEQLVDRCRRHEIGAQIARGYRERPQDDAEIAWADESSVRMIAEEPW